MPTRLMQKLKYTPTRTASDDEIVAAIRNFHEDHGYAPTVRELGDRIGLSSTSTVHQHLARLRRQGRVDWVDGSARTLHLKRRQRRTA